MAPKTQLDRIEERVDSLYATLHGDNGEPGIKGRLDRLEQTHNLTKWFAGTAVASLIAAVASWFHK